MNPVSRHSDLQAVEARLAARLSSGLTEHALQLPHDIGERLRFARERALARAAEVRRTAPEPRPASEIGIVGITSSGVALMGGTAPWWQRAAAILPLVVLVFGLLLIQRQGELEQVRAAAEVDTLLLSDDLPPDAYSDPGFAEFLREPAP
jgi:hypothetical protein